MYISKFPHGLMFHHVHKENSTPSGQGSITDKEFEEILLYVGIKNVISPAEWLHKLQNNKLHESDLCITFDDGLKCQFEVCLPILEKYNIKAFWFVYSIVFEGGIAKIGIYQYFMSACFVDIDNFFDSFFKKLDIHEISIKDERQYRIFYDDYKAKFPFYSHNDINYRFIRDKVLNKNTYYKIMDELMEEKGVISVDISKKLWMNNSDLKQLNEEGHHIGLHSYDHPTVISKLSFKQQYSQYLRNYEHLQGICNREIYSVAHPCGNYNNDTLQVLKKLKILCGFRSNMTPSIRGKINQSHLEIAREDSVNILKRLKLLA